MPNFWQTEIIFKREEESLACSLLNMICHQNWYQRKSDYMDTALVFWNTQMGLLPRFLNGNCLKVQLATDCTKSDLCTSHTDVPCSEKKLNQSCNKLLFIVESAHSELAQSKIKNFIWKLLGKSTSFLPPIWSQKI
jgi:hypothetical protein